MTLELKFRSRLFMMELEKYSNNKEDPISEWYYDEKQDMFDIEYGTELDQDDDRKCICSTPIKYIYKIRNKINGGELEIGSECIKRWIRPKIKCLNCECVLGCITERLRTKNFLCRTCRITSERHPQYLKLNGVSFYKISNINFIEAVINKEKKNEIEIMFERYINTQYIIKEVQAKQKAFDIRGLLGLGVAKLI